MVQSSREKRIVRTGIYGIVANIAIAVFKLVVGTLSHSISIVFDGINNAGDVLSSAVTVVGAKIAGRPADREHPFGHGRVEYVSAAVISAVILYVGITALIEAIKRIFSPMEPEYGALTFTVVAVSSAVKIVLGIFTLRSGKKLNSDSLIGSGKDALLDAAISGTVLVAAVVFVVTGLNLEAYLAVLISAVIIRAGVTMFTRTVSKIMGERVEGDLSRAIKETIAEDDAVLGAHDLILNSYGPDHLIGSVNIEVPDDMRADRIDALSRRITDRVYVRHGVILTAIGVYSLNSAGDGGKRQLISDAIGGIEHVLGIHGFYADEENRRIRFDVVVDFGAKDRAAISEQVKEAASAVCPGYEIAVHVDYDYSD